jgi:Mn-dependent DtxR family transcriptional regulator
MKKVSTAVAKQSRNTYRQRLTIRLHEKGYISDPATKAKSVVLTEEGAKRSQDLFEKYFTKST